MSNPPQTLTQETDRYLGSRLFRYQTFCSGRFYALVEAFDLKHPGPDETFPVP